MHLLQMKLMCCLPVHDRTEAHHGFLSGGLVCTRASVRDRKEWGKGMHAVFLGTSETEPGQERQAGWRCGRAAIPVAPPYSRLLLMAPFCPSHVGPSSRPPSSPEPESAPSLSLSHSGSFFISYSFTSCPDKHTRTHQPKSMRKWWT